MRMQMDFVVGTRPIWGIQIVKTMGTAFALVPVDDTEF